MADPNSIDVTELIKFVPTVGVSGVLTWVVYMLGNHKWVTREELERERARGDALQEFVTKEMTPALTRATDALARRPS